ncbi:Histone-lysine N-methyltransferase mes-2 [Frankliniella fusca]|uniref:Histone-lysine N-methyltransferase mes-2 n=1 Tax=Frankliniella fusca TaxID=407009 RepID=A0AAE1HEE4_9NEOP|nr:Histone-lysine N-methyltransferase mes-2 [Frankliniella fusca]
MNQKQQRLTVVKLKVNLDTSSVKVVKAKVVHLGKTFGNEELTTRSTATTSSITGGQGYTRCNCNTGCGSKQCGCFRARLKYNPKCQGSSACKHK